MRKARSDTAANIKADAMPSTRFPHPEHIPFLPCALAGLSTKRKRGGGAFGNGVKGEKLRG
eukprot:2864118-Rhodomonas_salina.2